MIQGFPPIADEDARILILGTVPSRLSLERAEYFANPRNAFWRIIEALFADGRRLSYPGREQRLKSSGVAVWDVLAAASRDDSSLDNDIRDPVPNDIEGFLTEHPAVRSIFFNGATAERLFRDHVAPTLSRRDGLRLVRLPSTSPANAALSFADKVEAWRVVLAAARPTS